jgi:hypothetical protein
LIQRVTHEVCRNNNVEVGGRAPSREGANITLAALSQCVLIPYLSYGLLLFYQTVKSRSPNSELLSPSKLCEPFGGGNAVKLETY